MPVSIPATRQLDWLSSTTAMIVLSWSKATRDLLKSFSWGIRALHQSVTCSDDGATSFAACPIPSLRWRKLDSNHRSPIGRVNLESTTRLTAPAYRALPAVTRHRSFLVQGRPLVAVSRACEQ